MAPLVYQPRPSSRERRSPATPMWAHHMGATPMWRSATDGVLCSAARAQSDSWDTSLLSLGAGTGRSARGLGGTAGASRAIEVMSSRSCSA